MTGVLEGYAFICSVASRHAFRGSSNIAEGVEPPGVAGKVREKNEKVNGSGKKK
jgi:hypothetical protein